MEKYGRKKAFTLAEVLITLSIIGVVAAITIPATISSYNDKQYNTARLKALKTFGEAGKTVSMNGLINNQPTAKAFVNNVLSNYLKISKNCDTALECGFPEKIFPSNKSSKPEGYSSDNDLKTWKQLNDNNYVSAINTESEAYSTYILTADGFSAKLFYNPECVRNNIEASYGFNGTGTGLPCSNKVCQYHNLKATCMNVIYDMNGAKAPNHVGEDIGFVTVMWSGIGSNYAAPGVPPYSVNENPPNKVNSLASGYCASKGNRNVSYSLPSLEELTSLILNKNLSSVPDISDVFGTGSTVRGMSGYTWAVGKEISTPQLLNDDAYVYCVRR